MAIKQRKQITGTTAQINSFAGHEGVLAFDKTTKHLHVLSGTAGTTTKLANMSDIPAPVDISGKADKTYVDQQVSTKQPKGDYATKQELNLKADDSVVVKQTAQTLGEHVQTQVLTNLGVIAALEELITEYGGTVPTSEQSESTEDQA